MTPTTPRCPAPMPPGRGPPRLENAACGPPSRNDQDRRPVGRSAAGHRSACCVGDRRCLPRRKGSHRRHSQRQNPAVAGWRCSRAPSCFCWGETSSGRRPGRPADRRTTAPASPSQARPFHSVPSLLQMPAPPRADQSERRKRCRLPGPSRPQHRPDRRG